MVMLVVLDDNGDADGACGVLVFEREREMVVKRKKKLRIGVLGFGFLESPRGERKRDYEK